MQLLNIFDLYKGINDNNCKIQKYKIQNLPLPLIRQLPTSRINIFTSTSAKIYNQFFAF